MKKLLILLFISTITANAQYFSVSYVMVAPEDVEDFERKEMNYWSKVAKQNVKDGKQAGWLLMRKVGTAGNNDVNYAFMNWFTSVPGLTNNLVWSESAKKLGYNPQDISSPYKVHEIHFYKGEDNIPSENIPVWVWNYARPENIDGFISENKNLWKPYHAKNIKSKSHAMKGWGIATKLYPSERTGATVMTADGYSSISDISKWDGGPKGSKMTEYNPDGFAMRIIWEIIKTSN